jgi:protein-disulfide isomerase
MLVVMTTILLWANGPLLAAHAISLEEQVLQILRDNPEVILESVQNYQEQQEALQRQAQQTFLQQLQVQPASIIGDSPILGSPEAEFVLLEFSDFQCPFCGQAHTVVQDFMDKHQDEVTFVYKNFPLVQIHPQAQPAALAAWAAFQQGKYWPFHDALFELQNQLGEDLYLALAEDLDLDLEQFNRDRSSSKAVSAINQDVLLAEQAQIRGTPRAPVQ